MLTRTERIIIGLTRLGYVEKETASRKYKRFEKPGEPLDQRLWVGKAGAVRRGLNSTDSYPVSDAFKRQLLKFVDVSSGAA